MRNSFKVALLATALAASGCASDLSSSPHRHGVDRADMASGEGSRDGMQGAMMGMTPLVGCHGARGDVDARLASVRAALQITPAQESAWGPYAAAFRAHAEHMGAGMMGMGAGAAAQPPVVDRLRHHEAMMSQHMASFQALRGAIDTLYASLSAEQKAAADALHCGPPS